MSAAPALPIAACLAFRNAAPYLREWLLFHLTVGVERFFLYDNDSEDDFASVLAPFLALRSAGAPVVHLIRWPGYFQQNAIYNDCLRRARGHASWLAFIDDDEFLFPCAGHSLAATLARYQAHAGVAVCWQLYGSSQRIYQENDWVIRRFVRRAPAPDQHVKCIVQPDAVSAAIAGGHAFAPVPHQQLVDECLRAMTGPLTAHPSADILRINHYLVKSIEELVTRRTRRDIGTGDQPKLPLTEWLGLDRGWNTVEDPSAQRFAARMTELDRTVPKGR